MDGAGAALVFIFRPSFSELEPGSILEALGRSFFTLSLGMGAMITYGTYVARRFDEARWVCLGTSVPGTGFKIFRRHTDSPACLRR